MATKYAIGTNDAWNALTPAEQAEYAAHYTSFYAWTQAMNGGTNWSDNVEATLISSVTEPNYNTSFSLPNAGYNLTVNSTSPADGSLNNGHIIDFDAYVKLCLAFQTSGDMLIDGLSFYHPLIEQNTEEMLMVFVEDAPLGNLYTLNVTVKNCVFRDIDEINGNSALFLSAYGSARRQCNLVAYNCKAYKCHEFISTVINPDIKTVVVENVTGYEMYNGISTPSSMTGKAWTFRNCAFLESTMQDYTFVSSANVTVENCAASDGSLSIGSNVINDAVAATEFESLDTTSDDFLKLKSISLSVSVTATPESGAAPLDVAFSPVVVYSAVGELAQSGTTPTYATTDIEGYERPGIDGYTSIGCHEAQVPA